MAFFRQQDDDQGKTKPQVAQVTKMTEFLSEPKDKDFFASHFFTTRAVVILGYGGQVLSGITEFIAVAMMTGYKTEKAFYDASNLLPICCGLLAVFIFEVVGVRVLLKDIVRTIKRFKKGEAKKTEEKILFVFGLFFFVITLVANIYLSVSGEQITLVDKKISASKEDVLFNLEQERAAKIAEVNAAALANNTSTNKAAAEERKIIIDNYVNSVKVEKDRLFQEVKDLQSTSNASNELYVAKQIRTANTESSKKIKVFTEQKDEELKALSTRYQTSSSAELIKSINKAYDEKIKAVKHTETTNKNLWDFLDGMFTVLLIAFILIGIFAIIYEEVYYSGAESKVIVKEIDTDIKPNLILLLAERLYTKGYFVLFWLITALFGNKKYKYNLQFQNVEFKAARLPQIPKIAAHKRQQIGFNTAQNVVSQPVTNTQQTETAQKAHQDFFKTYKQTTIRQWYVRGILGQSETETAKIRNAEKYALVKAEAKQLGIVWKEDEQTVRF